MTDFRLLTIGLSLLLIAGCGCAHNNEPGSNGGQENIVQSGTHALTLKIQEYHQHCGGMPPTPEMEANSTRPASRLVYYLYEGTRPTRTSDFTRIVSNSEGIITLVLANGNYRMIQEDKLLSLEEFITLKNIEGIHYSAKPSNCYEDWRNRPDLSVSLTSDTTMQFTINHKCFTGTNPCLDYTGPYPP